MPECSLYVLSPKHFGLYENALFDTEVSDLEWDWQAQRTGTSRLVRDLGRYRYCESR